ncbi:MAG: CPBP family intramembrane metalloprotease [Candidatus Methanomethylophilaceae archaeon]|nr:CPBP family intramembrane metalloprotease [Candidatus Methanomethylophilaceae archaeon]
MTCDRCDSARKEGYRFCPVCGGELGEGPCQYCDEYRAGGYEYCGRCGAKLRDAPEPEDPNSPLKMGAVFSMPFILILLILELGILIYAFPETLDWLSDKTVNIFFLSPDLRTVGHLSGISAQIYWVVIAVAIVLSAVALLYQSRNMFSPDRNKRNLESAEKTPLFWICLLFGSTIIIELVINLLQGSFGQGIVAPEGLVADSLPEDAFTFARAAFWEEIVSRLIPIGLPMMALAICAGRKDFLRYLYGGYGMSRVALALLIVTSIVFGVAHVDLWGINKVATATLGGLVMGLLYIKFGLHASIVFHFLTDYMSVAMTHVSAVLTAAILLVILVVGLVCLVEVFMRLRKVPEAVRKMPAIPDWESKGSEDGTETDP